jgi:hypothetical protein
MFLLFLLSVLLVSSCPMKKKLKFEVDRYAYSVEILQSLIVYCSVFGFFLLVLFTKIVLTSRWLSSYIIPLVFL